MSDFKSKKSMWFGGAIGFLLMLIGFLGTIFCNWNILEGGVVPCGICSYLKFIYIIYFGIMLCWSIPFKIVFPLGPANVTNWTSSNYILNELKYAIPTILLGTLIGLWLGYLLKKLISKK